MYRRQKTFVENSIVYTGYVINGERVGSIYAGLELWIKYHLTQTIDGDTYEIWIASTHHFIECDVWENNRKMTAPLHETELKAVASINYSIFHYFSTIAPVFNFIIPTNERAFIADVVKVLSLFRCTNFNFPGLHPVEWYHKWLIISTVCNHTSLSTSEKAVESFFVCYRMP